MSNFLIQINIPIFHYSIIPSGLHETCSIENDVISISCTISKTLIIGCFSFPVYSCLTTLTKNLFCKTLKYLLRLGQKSNVEGGARNEFAGR